MAKLIQVIETEYPRGDGKSDNDPYRLVTQYWSVDGVLLAERDPCDASLPDRYTNGQLAHQVTP